MATATARRSVKAAPKNAGETIAFTMETPGLTEVFERTRELADLGSVRALVSWDQQTQMAMGANIVRGPQMATLSAVIHERWAAPSLGKAIAKAEKELTAEPDRFSDADRALVRDARREHDEATKLPDQLVRDYSSAVSDAWGAWIKAKQAKDFSLFADPLARVVDLNRTRAHHLNPDVSPYAALFDLYEPGMPLEECLSALDRVRSATIPLLKRVKAAKQIDDSSVAGSFADDKAMQLSRTMLETIGYQFENGRIDLAAHPFMTSIGSPYDARVTTRLDKHNIIRALLPAMHEGGHALYELGVDPALSRTILGHGTSLGIHESQSRGWENLVGRSEPFWRAHYHKVQKVFPKPFKDVSLKEFVRVLNRVEPDFIRVEADELTYNLHIIIRVEIERDLINGAIEVRDLPGIWNRKYHDYLGIDPPNDAVGVLQDIHWSHGSMGYFSTYTLGNLYAAQFVATLRKAFPDMDDRLAAGETSFIREWQRENIHRWGKIFRAADLSKRVTGETLNPDHFISYATAKFEKLYNLKPAK